ncbi:hypothetical protein KY285_025610 [Solanum tuberosum]|nr:hypothetical protein KY285_025610 [Solanum tuberosum]
MAERVGHFCFVLLSYHLEDKTDENDDNELEVSQVNSMLVHLLLKIIPVSLEVMHICCTNLKGSKSEDVGRFIKQLIEASPDIVRESLIHLQEHMVINAVTPNASTCNIHVMIEFLLIILTDVPKDAIRHDKLFVLLARVRELTKEVFILFRNLEENMNATSGTARADSYRFRFPMSDGPLFMTLILTNLNDLVNSNASSVASIKKEIKKVKEDLKIIRSFFGYVEQEFHRDLWTRVLDVAYESEHLIFILPDTVEKIRLVKKEVQEKIPKSSGIIVANAPNKPVERNSSSTVGKIIVGFEEETEWIVRKLTSGPAEIDVISIVGMPGLGKTTLAYRVYNDKSIVDHFDVCAWCTVDQERNEKNERKKLCGQRYLIVLDDLWDTATLDELTRPFPEFQKGSRVILTSRKKEVALHGKCHSDPLYLRLLRSEESWELLEKRVFGEECCPDELKDVGEKIARKKEKKEALWVDVLNNLSSFSFKDEEEVVKDKDIRISQLKDFWIGQGLEMKNAEEVVDALILSSLENVFDFIGGSNAPSSSSSVMARGITICYNEYLFHLDENFVVFNPEKKNPYVKHLFSLKVYDGIHDCLSYNSHLKHLRLLKSLDLKGLTLPDSLLNEIGMLVHLKYLIIQTKAKALPPLFSNLCNLETLSVYNIERSCMILSPCFWSLAKLRDVRMMECALFEPTVLDEDSRLESLRTLQHLSLPGSEDMEDIFKRFPNLQILSVSIIAEKICFPRLDVLNELEQLNLSASWDSFHECTHGFLLSLKKMRLQGLTLTSDSLSRIARLPNLQKLSLKNAIIDGEPGEWNMEDVTFKNLKYLKLDSVEFSEWQVDAEKSFPVLEMLDIITCEKHMDIPDSFGDIASLELIKVWFSPQLKESIFNIKEYVEEMTGEDKLHVCFQGRWSRECEYEYEFIDFFPFRNILRIAYMEIGKENEGEMEKLASNSLRDRASAYKRLARSNQPVSSVKSLRQSLIHLQEHMVINAVTPSASTCNIHVMIEFLLIILTDVLKDVIRHDKLFVLLARVRELTKEVFVLVRNLEENMNEASDANLNLLESIELLKEDLKNDFLKARADSSQLRFPMSDGPLFMTLLLTNLKDLVNSNASSIALIKKEIKQVKEDLEIIRSFFEYVEKELHRDLWTRVLDVAYEAEHAIHSILSRDHGLLQLIFILPDTVEKIKLVKKEVQEKIPKISGIIVANAPNKLVERNSSSTVGKIVGFEEETEWIIRKLTSGPDEIDVISIVGMPGIGKTTLAFRVYNDKSIVDHFDVCAWCTVDQERNEKKLLQKIFNQVIGLKEKFSEDDIDDDVADKLRKKLCGQRYLIVLDDMWDTATLDELTRPFPEFQKGSRLILTSRKKEVALHGKCQSDPLYLRLLRPEESWELLEKRVFGEEHCPDELKDVGEKIARKCDGLPLVLDLIGGVISRKEKKEALWLEVLDNLSSFIFKDEEEVVKVIQLSYDHLSDHVKPCLVYLASYPKDKDIRISELKDLWISQGLVEQIEMKSAEEVVDELIFSSLVLPFDNYICKIHDLVHDFCYIKSRKEKLLHFIEGLEAPSSSSSSSGLMPRGIIIRFDGFTIRLNGNFAVFNPKKMNPYVKHLLSLKACMLCLPHKSHLKHLRLLKSLDLKGITLKNSLLNEIGMLVHLKYLIIQTRSDTLPRSFSNLCNLETLVVDHSERSHMLLSPWFWSLAKLRDVQMKWGALFEPTVLDEDSRLENLRTLSKLHLPGLEDTEDIIFKRFPNLQNLEVCIGQLKGKICFPKLDVLNELEELRLYSIGNSFSEYTHGFPLSLKKMRLRWLSLTSDTLSRIGRLPNLQELILKDTIIEEGKEWNMEDVTFQNLKSLKLLHVEFSEWQVDAEKSFPVLEKLDIDRCDKLMEIPDSFGDIASLELIKLWLCPQLRESAINIKEYVEEMTGEDKLKLHIFG